MRLRDVCTAPRREGSYAQAIELCKQARFQSWDGNWTWRIDTLARKPAERGDPIRNISSSGLTPL